VKKENPSNALLLRGLETKTAELLEEGQVPAQFLYQIPCNRKRKNNKKM
jgi:hypothetical protein